MVTTSNTIAVLLVPFTRYALDKHNACADALVMFCIKRQVLAVASYDNDVQAACSAHARVQSAIVCVFVCVRTYPIDLRLC